MENIKLTKVIRPDLVLIVGGDAVAFFDYFEATELNGLKRTDCVEQIMNGGVFIDSVLFKNKINNIYYLFVNEQADKSKTLFQKYATIFGEAVYYAVEKYSGNILIDTKEILNESENISIDICKLIY